MPATADKTNATHPLADLAPVGLDELVKLLGRDRTTIYRLQQADPSFPRPLRIRNQPRWLASEIRAYVIGLANARPGVHVEAADPGGLAPTEAEFEARRRKGGRPRKQVVPA
jgi:predicted DNA-binding transcriptional regulator AlpA